MKPAYLISFLVAAGVSSLLASPVSIFIDSSEMLDELDINIKHKVFSGISEGASTISVEVTWKPVPKDRNFPPRLDLIIEQPGELGENRVQVRFSPDENGLCKADFSVSSSETEYTLLIFRNGQHTVHGFILSDYLQGFPKPGLGFSNPAESTRKDPENPTAK